MDNILEKDIQQWLAFILGGRREQVITHVGRLDIIVKEPDIDYIIEVKKADNFLSAIGQVTSYVQAFKLKDGITTKERVKIIALFGWKKLKHERRQMCDDICESVDIKVWWIDECFLRFIYDLEKNQVETGGDFKPTNYFLEQFRYKRQKIDSKLEFRNRMVKPKVEDENVFIIEDSDEEDIRTKVNKLSITKV
jgi:hypothetical protein